jgi:hypothetical protein
MIIFFIFIFIFLFYIQYSQSHMKESYSNNYFELNLDNLFKYSLMIHLNNHELSENRLKKLDKIYKNYGIKYTLFPALHWKKDEKELKTLPIIKSKPYMVNGPYGLAGSFYKSLKHARDNNYPFLLYLEDDSIPLLDKNSFFKKFILIINSIKSNLDKNHVFFLSYTKYCDDSLPCKNINKFIKRADNNIKYGTGSIIFTKKSIDNILNYIEKNKIHLPIDVYLNFLENKNIINTFTWEGNVSENGMFCGIYEQLDTNCKDRNSINSIEK